MTPRIFLFEDMEDQVNLPEYYKVKYQMIPLLHDGTLRGGESIKPGTLHEKFTPATYRTTNGNGIYRFEYIDKGDYFDIDILSQPSYGGRKDDLNTTHRLTSDHGGKKICLSAGHEPVTIEEAKKISMEWAELTQAYIESGKTLDKQVRENASGGSLWKKIIG